MKGLLLFIIIGDLVVIFAIGFHRYEARQWQAQTASVAPGRPTLPPALPAGGTVLDKARLMAAALAGGEYILRMQQADGSFVYYYDPAKDEIIKTRYNIIRHAGAAYSLFQLYEATRDPRYLGAARKAMAFLRTRFRPLPDKDAIYVLDFDDKAKLGANGLALVAMVKQLELDPGSANLDEARELANMIIAQQRKDGSFQSYHLVPGGELANDSLYYPGEAMLGLVSLYTTTKDKRLLDAARTGADYLVAAQDKMPELPPDAWLMEALEALNKIGPNQGYINHAIAIAETMISYLYTESDPAGYAGGVRPGIPRSTPTASRAEGLLAAYRMALEAKDRRAADLGKALQASARFQLQQQFPCAGQSNFPNPQRAAGGFRESLKVERVRIDYVQHNVSSLLGVARTLY
jgi:rhamnogalacturonyl hydrolase YesR